MSGEKRINPWEIRMQADDFFNAYRVLKESNEVMMGKLEKLSGKPLLNETAFGSFPVSTPSVVCLAFAIELYIKELYFVMKLKVPRGRNGHNILELFRELPIEVQEEIRQHSSIKKVTNFYSMQAPIYIPQDKDEKPIDDIFEQQLYKISNSFEKWRYSYESATLQYEVSFALDFIKAVKSVADSKRKLLSNL